MCACAGDTKIGNLFASLYVVHLYGATEPSPTFTKTDPALRPANATDFAKEDPRFRPTFGYVYA